MNIRLPRVRTYPGGMRVVEMSYHYKIDLWAQTYNTTATSYIDPYDSDYFIVEFPTDKIATLFALTYNHSFD